MEKPVITIRNVDKYYGSGAGRQQVLHGVNLDVNPSELLSIVGTSGSGKSTLLNIIGGLDRDYTGSVEVTGLLYKRLSDSRLSSLRNHTLGFIFQAFNLLDHLTCWENVALPYYFDRKRRSDVRERAVEVLKKVGLAEKAFSKPSNLSGGQKQRVAIARALFNDPSILLCDEPTGNLDSDTGRQIIDLFRELNSEYGITLILVTHEDRVSQVADRIIRLEDGKITEETTRKAPEPEQGGKEENKEVKHEKEEKGRHDDKPQNQEVTG